VARSLFAIYQSLVDGACRIVSFKPTSPHPPVHQSLLYLRLPTITITIITIIIITLSM